MRITLFFISIIVILTAIMIGCGQSNGSEVVICKTPNVTVVGDTIIVSCPETSPIATPKDKDDKKH